jgi:hypothetical protein
MCDMPTPSSSSALRSCRWDIRSDRCQCPRESGWQYQAPEISTFVAFAAVVALVMVPCLLASTPFAVQAQTLQLLPAIGLAPWQNLFVLVGRQTACRPPYADQVDCRVHRGLCLGGKACCGMHCLTQRLLVL